MNRLITKEQRLAARYRPAACTETIEHAHGVIYHSPDKLHGIGYSGTAGRPSFHYTFRNAAEADRQFASFFAQLDNAAKYRAERAAATRAARTNNIGEIYRRACESGRISSAETATLIRHRLRIQFPGVTFKVRTEDHGTVNVHWTDGPSQRAVDALLDTYEFGGFDGSIDMAYHADRWLYQDGTMSFAYTSGTAGSKGCVSEHIGDPLRGDAVLVTSGPRYVFGHRRTSFGAALADARRICAKYGAELPEHATTDERSLWNYLHSHRHGLHTLSDLIHIEQREADDQAAA